MRRLRSAPKDAGFTLVELSVAMVIMVVLGGMLLNMLLSLRTASQSTTQRADLVSEARGALNRVGNDLKVAVPLSTSSGSLVPAITAVSNPLGPNYSATAVTSFTFNTDVSGDGCVTGIASANISPAGAACSATSPSYDSSLPETESICFDPNTQQLYLLAPNPAVTAVATPVTSCGAGLPLLAGKVTSFTVDYRSSNYRFQNLSGTSPAGTTTWFDLDRAGAPVGDGDELLGTTELRSIDAVVLTMTLKQGRFTQTYSTEVDLRNVHAAA